jgi:hypothetical protein
MRHASRRLGAQARHVRWLVADLLTWRPGRCYQAWHDRAVFHFRTVQVWAGLDRVHVLLGGHRIKTLPSRLDRTDISRLIASGTTPAGQPPLPPATGPAIEPDRTVNASGNVTLGSHVISVGMPLARQRITLRLDGPVARILTGGTLTRTVACPIPEQDRPRLRGARPGQPGRPSPRS